MNRGSVVVWAILAIILFIGLVGFASIIGFRNDCVSMQKTIDAQVTDMKAKYNEFFTKVKEVAQVPKEQMSQLKEFYDKLVTGRQSSAGEMMRWISESNPNIDQSTYVEIQRIIAAGRSEIYNIQKVHIDTVRAYNTALVTFPNTLINSIFFRFEERKATVPIASNVDTIFNTGVDQPMSVF